VTVAGSGAAVAVTGGVVASVWGDAAGGNSLSLVVGSMLLAALLAAIVGDSVSWQPASKSAQKKRSAVCFKRWFR
jgi:hypothetical protein